MNWRLLAGTLFVCFACANAGAQSATESTSGELPAVAKIEDAKPRNVVFILTDDHRYDAMGFMGHPFLETPHLDYSRRTGGI